MRIILIIDLSYKTILQRIMGLLNLEDMRSLLKAVLQDFN